MPDSNQLAWSPSAGEPTERPKTIREAPATPVRSVPFALYVAAIFASAFLIFLVQPMVGRRILPWFGGVPAVWTLCLAFYQSALFLGYAYAHGLIRLVRPALQPAIHALVVGSAFLGLPVLPGAPPDAVASSEPTRQVLALLAGSVALPFVALASTGPLVQAWFALAHPTRSPYLLYAISNVGSFLALFAYPFLLEPRLPLTQTGRAWGHAFALTGLLVLGCGLPLLRLRHDAPAASAAPRASGEIRPARALLWTLLSGTAVVVLMGVTNKLCLDVASIPFLWIVPLAIYLLTFIVAFSADAAYRRPVYVTGAFAAFGLTRLLPVDALIVWQVVAYGLLLFCIGMVLHGELYRARPEPHALTAYYLCLSAGGAIAGLFTGIAAPRLFDDYHELAVGLLLALVLLLAVCVRDPASWIHPAKARWRAVAVGALCLGAAAQLVWLDARRSANRIHQVRSFFGVLKVDEVSDSVGQQRSLMNGTTIHGSQFMARHLRRLPTAYFGRATGLGLVLSSRPARSGGRIGVIGLGVGTIAAYGRRGDTMRFYEIDPDVIAIAGRGGHFSFLEDSEAEIELVLGDARLAIEDEQRRGVEQAFDFLVLDAFSSDSIPIHLMTREAFALYERALAPDGLMVVHVSNRHFHLMSLISRMAAELGRESVQIRTRSLPHLQSSLSDWVVLARDSDQLTRVLDRIGKRHRALDLSPDTLSIRRGSELDLSAVPVWRDDYSDLFRVLRWDRG